MDSSTALFIALILAIGIGVCGGNIGGGIRDAACIHRTGSAYKCP